MKTDQLKLLLRMKLMNSKTKIAFENIYLLYLIIIINCIREIVSFKIKINFI